MDQVKNHPAANLVIEIHIEALVETAYDFLVFASPAFRSKVTCIFSELDKYYFTIINAHSLTLSCRQRVTINVICLSVCLSVCLSLCHVFHAKTKVSEEGGTGKIPSLPSR